MYRAFGGVLHRYDAEIGIAGFDFLKYLVQRTQRQCPHRMPEMLQHGTLAEGAFRPEESDPQRALLGQAGRHDLAKHPDQFGVAQRTLIAIDDAAQYLRLALRTIVVQRGGQRPLGQPHLTGKAGPLGDQALDLPVDVVNAAAQLGQVLRFGVGHVGL